MTVYLPLRRLDDEELRRHAQRLFDSARGVSGGACVWLFGARKRVPTYIGAEVARRLSHALGCFDPSYVRAAAHCCAREAGKIRRTDAVRALCEVARRAKRGAYGAPQEDPRVSEIADPAACDLD